MARSGRHHLPDQLSGPGDPQFNPKGRECRNCSENEFHALDRAQVPNVTDRAKRRGWGSRTIATLLRITPCIGTGVGYGEVVAPGGAYPVTDELGVSVDRYLGRFVEVVAAIDTEALVEVVERLRRARVPGVPCL